MRSFDSVSRSVLAGRGRGGGAIGDILYFAENPGDTFIPISNRRVYADQYPNLAGVLLERRENDGGEWLRPGGIVNGADPSGGQPFFARFGGTSGGENFMFFYSGNAQPVVARGPANTKTFTSLSLFAPGSAAKIDGAVSDSGTVIVARLVQGSDYARGDIIRSTDALRTHTQRAFTTAGLGTENANRFGQGPISILPMGGGRWIIVSSYGDVYRSDDDGLNWTFVKTLTWTGRNASGSIVQEEKIVLKAIAVGSRIWVALGDFSQNAGNGSEYDALIWSDDLFANYGRIRAKNPSMNDVYPSALGMLGGDLVLIQRQRTNSEANAGNSSVPIRGMYLASADPTSSPAFFEMTNTAPYGGSVGSIAVFSWDGIGYMGIPTTGLFRVEPKTFAKTFLASVRGGGNVGGWNRDYSFVRFPTFALVFSEQSLTLPQWSAEFLQAVPTDLARRYYQFSDASVVGAQRADGKLPYMKAA